jgi:YhcH/YjgK/YiaL family protein
MALFGSYVTIRSQVPAQEGFDKAFRYVQDLLRAGSDINQRLKTLKAGESAKIELGEGVFVIEQAYLSKVRADGFFESHRKYIDVQILVSGEERMELVDISRIKAREPYNAERDFAGYEDCQDASVLKVYAGQIAVFFPNDVHMPSLRLGGESVLVHKSVVKIPVY